MCPGHVKKATRLIKQKLKVYGWKAAHIHTTKGTFHGHDHDDPNAADVTTDDKRLKWEGQRFVNVAVTQRVIEKENFDEDKFMPNEASTSVQALQWNGSEFVHGEFANTNYIDAEIAKKVGKNYDFYFRKLQLLLQRYNDKLRHILYFAIIVTYTEVLTSIAT